ncbi:hypothetical protein M2323_003220 [Rhodoblastus acidophilus]|uniref:NepR family anti-sigma factor n=1 Tax=Rhodoblastus acidophilus TaxID=1074 RepID=UPI002224A870|nr:NepR family anti-sigma factor [Rhodoblastus acidophilus]MCW2285323.1 hypothetical protein [Rhodoblastus acidophilus]MCW2334279.1 hypothetical protein [Rhodoblastus acidophilus]
MTEKEEVVGAPLDKTLQAHLGRQLRRLFNETAAEPVPDRFVDLLERLDNESPRPPHPQQARAQEAL